MRAEIAEVELTGVPDPIPPGVCVIDVREDEEWIAGHIGGAVHVPMLLLPQRLDVIPVDRQVLVVCKVGSRSARATAYLQSQGIEAVNLVGGMLAWQAGGRPMVSEHTGPPDVV